jgi:hypothetical protein
MPIINLTTSYLGIIPPNDPVVTFVSATGSSITVNITNPNEYSVKAYYGHTNPNPTLNTTISANSNQNVTVSGLTAGTNYTIYAYLENTENNSKSITVSVLASTPSELYAFTTFTFTNAGVTGGSGPTLAQLRSSYSSSSWTQNNDYFNITTQGIQLWTVPATGNYIITARGAQGGGTSYGDGRAGGLGAVMVGTFNLTQGQKIKILVGQMGGVQSNYSSYGGGGGGGTFVATQDNIPLIVAGGGGGATGNGSSTNSTINALTSTSGQQGGSSGGAGGTNGGGGGQGSGAPNGGGGFIGNGVGSYVANSFINGGTGSGSCTPGAEGFGGGSGSCGGGGGGGGYSGGGGGGNCCGGSTGGGGGGGSYNNGSNQNNSISNTSHGNVVIQRL